MTDTLTNDAPMLTEDLAFDLGDVMKCGVVYAGCDNEPAWLCDLDCGCYIDMPCCDTCKKAVHEWTRMMEAPTAPDWQCRLCFRYSVKIVNWRPM